MRVAGAGVGGDCVQRRLVAAGSSAAAELRMRLEGRTIESRSGLSRKGPTEDQRVLLMAPPPRPT